MKIRCINGFYKFYPETTLDLVKFGRGFGELVPYEDYYTFKALRDMASYSIKGAKIGDAVATANFAGKKWEVLAMNGASYNVEKKRITATPSGRYKALPEAGNYVAFTSLPQAGFRVNGARFNSFFGYVDFAVGVIRVGELW